MIKINFLKSQYQKSHSLQKTTPFLKKCLASVVENAARNFWQAQGQEGVASAAQVAQSLVGLLEHVGISATLHIGEVCVFEVLQHPPRPSWGGFWGDTDYSVWVETEFGEIVDLSLPYWLTRPGLQGQKALPIPALWWSEAAQLPAMFHYKARQKTQRLAFQQPADQDALTKFEQYVEKVWQETLDHGKVEGISYPHLITDAQSLQDLRARGNLWIQWADGMQDFLRRPPLTPKGFSV